MSLAELRSQHFSQALAAADGAAAPGLVPEEAAPTLRQRALALTEHPVALAAALALTCLAVLLVVRPPFALTFEHDQRKPWRGRSRVCWIAVLATTAIVVGAVSAVPQLPSL